jgi:hypothetical protein
MKHMRRWIEPDNTPIRLEAPTSPAFASGERVAVVTLDDPPRTFYGELRAIDDGLAVVFIAGRSERVPVEYLRKLDSQGN